MKPIERLWLILVVVLSFSLSVVAQNKGALDLNGKWKTGDGDEVVIHQSGQSLTATFVSGGQCKHGGGRSYYIQGALQGDSLRGDMQNCTKNKKLLDDCGLNDPHSVKFQATATLTTISGTFYPDYVNYDEKGGHYTNCRVRTGGGSPQSFTLTRTCNPDASKLCTALSDAYQSITTVVNTLSSGGQANFNFASWKEKELAQLNKVDSQLCDNPGAQSRLESTVIDPLSSLDSSIGKDQLALNLEDIQRSLNQLRVNFLQVGGPCSAIPPSGKGPTTGDKPPPGKDDSSDKGNTNPPSDNNQCANGEEPMTGEDGAALAQLIFAIQSDINQLNRQLRVAGHSRTAAAIRNKISKLKEMKSFWEQAASRRCMPPQVWQAIKAYVQARRTGGDKQSACSQLCSVTAQWLQGLDNSPLQQLFSLEDCLITCK